MVRYGAVVMHEAYAAEQRRFDVCVQMAGSKGVFGSDSIAGGRRLRLYAFIQQ